MVRIISGNKGGIYQYNIIISHQTLPDNNKIIRANREGLWDLHLHAIEQI